MNMEQGAPKEDQQSYKDWIASVIEAQLQEGGIRNSEYKFYNVERLIRIAGKMEEEESHCQTCKKQRKELNDLAQNLHYYLNTSNKTRSQFEKKHDMLAKHLKKQHGIVTAGYHTHFNTFIGILLGLIAGFLSTFMYGGEILKIGLFSGAALGLIMGRNIGMRKEVRKHKAGKIL